jgi:uncharacterized repeat protein (TIGR01451 family)
MVTTLRALQRCLLLAALASVPTAPLAWAQTADIAVTKSGPAQAAAGTDVTYTVTVLNTGPDDVSTATTGDITLTDSIPAGMTFVSASPPGCTTPVVGSGSPPPISCTITSLAANASVIFTFVFHIAPATPPGTFFTNVAKVSNPTDPNDENDNGVAVTQTPPPPQADVGVTKTGPPSAPPNGDVVFTIAISNGGPDPATSVTWQDTLPLGVPPSQMTFVSLAPNSGAGLTCTLPSVGSAGTVTCTIASLAVGATATFTLTGHIPPGTSSGTTYDNTASVSAATADPNSINDSSTAPVVVSTVDVSVVKTGPANVVAGNDATYTLAVSNGGPDVADNVNLTDPLPPATTFVSLTQDTGPVAVCSTPASGGTGTVVCNWSSLASGASASFTLVIKAGNTTSISNTASVTTDSFDTNTSNNNSTATTTVTPRADVAVTKVGPATISAGANIAYTVTVTNNGPSDAASVSFTDTLPPSTTFVSESQTTGPTFGCATPAVGGTGTITCTIASLPAGATATFSIVLQVSAAALSGSTVSNTAGVSTTTTDPDPTNNNSTTGATVTTAISADVSVAKTGPSSAIAGTTVTYTVTVANAGPSNAASVSLSDTVPTGTTFVSESQTTGPAFACATPAVGGTGTITCTIASLAAGGSATFSIVVNVPAGATGQITNTATVSTSTSDPNSANNSSTVATAITTGPDVSVTKSGPASVVAGANATYTITVANGGSVTATSVSLTDTLPAGTTFVSETQTAGPVFACTTPAAGATGTITCTIPTLPGGGSATFSVVVKVSSGATGQITNTATVTSTTPDPNPANNSASTTATVSSGAADLSIAKTASAPSAGSVTFSIVVTNNGPAAGQDVVVADVLPAGTTLTSVATTQGSCTSGSTVTCALGTLPAGGSVTITIVVSVQSNAAVSNTATVAGSNPDPNLANNSSTAAVGAAGIPTLSAPAFALLALVLIAAGFWVLRRRRPASTH